MYSKDDSINTKGIVSEYASSDFFKGIDLYGAESREKTSVFSVDTVEDRTLVGTETIVFDEIDVVPDRTGPVLVSHSEIYIKAKLALFVESLQKELGLWSDTVGDTSELRHIKNILGLVERYSRLFDSQQGTRILLGSIQNSLIKWKTFDVSKLKQFSMYLNRFKDGDISDDMIKSFSRDCFLMINRNGEK